MTAHFPFTTQWAETFASAGTIAAGFGHPNLSADHLLLGMLTLPDSAMAEAAHVLGADAEAIKSEIDAQQSEFDADTVAVAAIQISAESDHYFFGTDHLAAGLCLQKDSHVPLLRELNDWCIKDVTDATQIQDPIVCYLAGFCALSRNSLHTARNLLLKACDGYEGRSGAERRYADASFNLGLAYLRLESFDDALICFQRTSEIYTALPTAAHTDGAEYIVAHSGFHLGRIAQLQENHERAMTRFGGVLKFYACLPGVDRHLGRCAIAAAVSAFMLGQHEAAVELARVASAAHAKNIWGDSTPAVEQCDTLLNSFHEQIRQNHRDKGTLDAFDAGVNAVHEGIGHYRNKELDKGVAWFRRALKSFEAASDAKQVADARKFLALALTQSESNFSEADMLFKRALATYNDLGLSSSGAGTERQMGDLAQRMGSDKRAVAHYMKAYDLALKVGDRESAAEYLVLAAQLKAATHQHRDAIDTYLKAQYLFNILRDKRSADCGLQMGRSWRALPDGYATAKSVLHETAIRFRDFEDEESGVRALLVLADAAVEAADFPCATWAAQIAQFRVEIASITGETGDAARRCPGWVMERQGVHCAGLGLWTEAIAHHKLAGSAYAAVPWREGVAQNLGLLGRSQWFNNELENAAATFNTVVREYADVVSPSHYAGSLLNYGSVLNILGRKDEARPAIEEAQRRFLELGDPISAADAAANLRVLDGRGESIHQGRPEDIVAAKQQLTEAATRNKQRDYAEALSLSAAAVTVFRDARRFNDAVTAAETRAIAQRGLGAHREALDELMPFYDLPINGASLVRLHLTVGTLLYELRRIDEAEEYLRKALTGAQQVPSPEWAATAHYELGLLYDSVGRSEDALREFDADVAFRRQRPDDVDGLVSSLLASVGSRIKVGLYGRAHTILDEAEMLLGPDGGEDLRARCVYLRAATDQLQGNIGRSEANFAKAEQMYRSAGRLTEALKIRGDLGISMSQRGVKRGIDLLISVLDEFESAAKEALSVEDRHFIGVLHFDLGTAYSTARNEKEALTHFTQARTILEALGDQAAVTECEHNIAWSEFRFGRPESARRMFQRLVARGRESGSNRIQLAMSLSNLGYVLRRMGSLTEAYGHYREAREIFFGAGRLINTADCDITAAAIQGSLKAPYREVLDGLLPAAIFIDGRRHQFSDAQQREQWKSDAAQSRWAFGCALEVAYREGDARLTADLIEFLINSGVYSASTEQDGGAQFASLAADDTDESVRARASHLGETNVGALRLVAGARLPMSPAPRLAWSDANLVLSPYVEESDLRYEPVARPATITI
ncbi:tetratricopeptide repeat protein [Mycobacterium sp. 1274756.6]|uniref:tetratricopeptide repeat protein n=1 Tax=Mycobacterium sp. 1274756.6 TaxID=1834076 RepID=UPI000B323403|nr:tetratricopeptide repeat protein [Mycobacterium sp. 1274756.6]